MRTLINKYAGECRKCSTTLDVGSEVVYEKRVGIFCPSCAPTDPEEIRSYRQDAQDKRADRLTEWAEKRREKAAKVLEGNKRWTSDHAFNTQPGHIPFRARVIAQNDRAYESMWVADEFERRAKRLRHVRVAGDADRKRNETRARIKAALSVGDIVQTGIYGVGIVERINKNTARVGKCGTSGTYSVNVDLSFLNILAAKKLGQKTEVKS